MNRQSRFAIIVIKEWPGLTSSMILTVSMAVDEHIPDTLLIGNNTGREVKASFSENFNVDYSVLLSKLTRSSTQGRFGL